MGILKLVALILLSTFFKIYLILFCILNTLYIYYSNNFILNSINYIVCYFPQNYVFFFFFKVLISLLLLILVRGGTPRYRYDYLTKLGWLKFLGLTLVMFVWLLFCLFLF